MPRTTRVIAAARSKGGPDVVYAAAGKAGLWRSIDAGVSWSRLPVAGNAQSVATTPARWQRVVAALPELAWSDDYGSTWHRSGPARDARGCGSAQRPHLVGRHARRRAARLDRRREDLVIN